MGSYSVESSLLYPDISDILSKYKNEKYTPIIHIESKLHTEKKDLTVSDGLVLNDINMYRNYIENIGDYIEASFLINPGTFIYDVYPFLDNIEVTLILSEQLTTNNRSTSILERFKAIYLIDKNEKIATNSNASKSDLNQLLPVLITLQLLPRNVETLRIKTLQGNFDKSINKNKDMKIDTFLKSLISEHSNKILIENKPSLDSIEIEKIDNIENLKSITIPSGTRLTDIPDFIQNKNIGIYNSGLGAYIQLYKNKKTFFIFSLYNGKKFNDAKNKIIIYMPITSSHSITDITYKEIDGVLKILAINNPSIEDNKEAAVMSKGSGFKISNANSYMKKPVEMTADGPKIKKNQLNTEIAFKDRKDNLNYAPVVSNNITTNTFKHTTEVIKNQGNFIDIEWHNGNHNLIYPGASVKIVYENKDNKIKEYFGVIHVVSVNMSNPKTNLLANSNLKNIPMATHIKLRIFIYNE
ncbi:MAG: hypothetical protein ACD_33C00008G0002 [uncultured bacterium]|nr:MAG: hypothetical protein ACD_33C00008G0002 [uncultured bacterium]